MDMLLLLISDKDAPPAKKGSEQSPVKDTDDDDDDEAPPPIVAPRPQHTISVSEDLYCHLYRVKWSYWFLSKHHIVGVFCCLDRYTHVLSSILSRHLLPSLKQMVAKLQINRRRPRAR